MFTVCAEYKNGGRLLARKRHTFENESERIPLNQHLHYHVQYHQSLLPSLPRHRFRPQSLRENPCPMMYEYPVARRELCASCAQTKQAIRETEALMRNIREHLHNAQVEALTDAMAGLSAAQRSVSTCPRRWEEWQWRRERFGEQHRSSVLGRKNTSGTPWRIC